MKRLLLLMVLGIALPLSAPASVSEGTGGKAYVETTWKVYVTRLACQWLGWCVDRSALKSVSEGTG